MSDIYEQHEKMVEILTKSGKTILAEMSAEDVNLWHMATGLAGEGAEVLDAVKKRVVYRKDLDLENIIEELGDLEYFMEGMRKAIGVSRSDCLSYNLNKLKKRYEGLVYSDKAAHVRADKI